MNIARSFLQLAVAATLAVTAGTAGALEITRVYNDPDGSGSITFDDDLGGNQLRLTFDNTSDFTNDGLSSLITGIVFNIEQDIDGASVSSFEDGDGNDLSSDWVLNLDFDNETTPGNTQLDVTFETTTGVMGGIYNAADPGDTSGSVVPDIATLIISVSSPNPWSLSSISDDLLRMQRTGTDGEGSLKIPGDGPPPDEPPPDEPMPAPGTLVLLGLGLLSFRLFRRRRA